jgi:hypothetical protein
VRRMPAAAAVPAAVGLAHILCSTSRVGCSSMALDCLLSVGAGPQKERLTCCALVCQAWAAAAAAVPTYMDRIVPSHERCSCSNSSSRVGISSVAPTCLLCRRRAQRCGNNSRKVDGMSCGRQQGWQQHSDCGWRAVQFVGGCCWDHAPAGVL